ncbi:MAG: PspA/IM30 family protein [Chloroflexota bacterium]|nr:PspA/IM30 family protein [Chloroflexota bacterium]
MADLFKKLGVLIQARVNDAIPEALNPATPARRRNTLKGGDLDREVAHLRQSVNEAVEYESTLTAQVTALEIEIARWDAQANAAVAQGSDTAARDALGQMKRAQERLTMAQSDLSQHQLVTEDLIRRVNLLDAVVADGHADAAAANGAPPEATTAAPPAPENRAAAPSTSEPTPNADDDLARRRQRLSKP